MGKYILYRTRNHLTGVIETILKWCLIIIALFLFIFVGIYVNRCLFIVDYRQECVRTQWDRTMGWMMVIPRAPLMLYDTAEKTVTKWFSISKK